MITLSTKNLTYTEIAYYINFLESVDWLKCDSSTYNAI